MKSPVLIQPKRRPLKKENGVETLLQVLNHFHPLGEGVEQFFRKHSFPVSFHKGKMILKAGEICEFIYFINKGAVRGFIREGHKDITTWITVDGEMVTSIYSLDVKTPASENIQAIEDCDMLAMTYTDLYNLYAWFPEFNIVTRKLLQKYYRDAEGRAFIARLTNAENKYRYFIEQSSHLANRVPLKYIASYLGMTLETLSRVRKKISSASK